MKNKNILLLLCILIPLAVGGIAALLTREGMMTYQMMRQPVLAPPAWLIPVVWTILYILMGVSAYLVKSSICYDKQSALQLYYIQLALNLMWTFFYFRMGMYLIAAIVLIALILAIVFTIIRFSQCTVTAGRLLLPYLIWCLFALYLNIAIVVLN